ncbi:type VII secretion protein EccB [Streptomyces catenulae]|uniref:Type VII secretion protein EccB n=1 Tax=Streptomyces catenulae TaxID=66875 RepID=A0ABV2Z6R7_9ACTN|nr:type VII secretion protein EccB [Streptomyces catenulae]
MQSRRDQVQAHLFVMSRLSAGMLRVEPDAADAPSARTKRGLIGGTVVAVLVGIGVALYGVISPGGATSWRKPGTLVLVDDSTTRYLYADNALHPVLNEASAKLVAGDRLTVQHVSAASLGGTPHGAPVGIVGAPDSVPAPDALDTGAWLACAGHLTNAYGKKREALSLAVGSTEVGDALDDNTGTLVTSPSGGVQLLWHGTRHRVDTEHGAHSAVGWSGVSPLPVKDEFLNTLSAGIDVASPPVPDRGTDGPELAGAPTRVGQLFTGSDGQHYVLQSQGLVPLTPLLFDLLRGDPRTQKDAYDGAPVQPRAIGPADLSAHQASSGPGASLAEGLPATAPRLVTAGAAQSVCTKVTPGRGSKGPTTGVVVLDSKDVPAGAPNAQPGIQAACLPSDRVWVRPGSGVLVRSLSSAGAGAADYLVTDAGAAYPLSAEAAKQFGYDQTQPATVPGQLVKLLPTGPRLDPTRIAKGGIVPAAASSATGCAPSGAGS